MNQTLIRQQMKKMDVQAVFLAARPKTLTISLIPVVVASVLAYHDTRVINIEISVLAFIVACLIQIATNIFNDVLDFLRGTDGKNRLGFTRMTAAGRIAPRSMFMIGLICLLLAASLSLPLIQIGGPIYLLVLFCSLWCAYGYTGGPYPIAYSGFGEAFVMVFFGLVSVMGTYYLLVKEISYSSIIVGLEIGALATVILALANFRDYRQDRRVKKMTLAASFGPRFAKWEILSLVFFTYLINLCWLFEGSMYAALLPLATIPIAFYFVQVIWTTRPSKAYNRFIGLAALLQILFGALLSLGLFLS